MRDDWQSQIALALFCAALTGCERRVETPVAQAVTAPQPQAAPAVATPVAVTGNAVETEVPIEDDGGTFVVPVTINDSLTLKFTVDSGAADVNIPSDVASTLVRTGTITRDDFIGGKTFMLADGSTVPSAEFRIRKLQVGTLVLHDVIGSLGGASGSLLLGQTFLSRLSTWSIDNKRHDILLKAAPGQAEENPQVVQATTSETRLADADLDRLAGEFNNTFKDSGMMGVSSLIQDCYDSVANTSGVAANKRAVYCVTMDVVAAGFDQSFRKTFETQTGKSMPPTPFFEDEKWQARVASHLPQTGLPQTQATTDQIRGYVTGATRKLAAMVP